LNRWQQQSDKNSNDGNDDQQLNQRKCPLAAVLMTPHVRELHRTTWRKK
jgi:hypothetical protein